MKKLCLVRHAKSNWEHPAVADIDRPLEPRGEIDASFMGDLLKEKSLVPDLILTSNANRALTTAKLLGQKLGYAEKKIEVNPAIYEAGVEDLLDILAKLPSKYKAILLIGHNPGLTFVANYLAEDHLINIPTCGAYCMEFPTDNWEDITKVEAKTLFFANPPASQG